MKFFQENKDKLLVGIIFVFLIARILVETGTIIHPAFVAFVNIASSVVMPLAISWAVFDFQFKRQKELDREKIDYQIKRQRESNAENEKKKVYTQLFEILTRAMRRESSNDKEFLFMCGEIKKISELFEDSKSLLSKEIVRCWEEIRSEEQNNVNVDVALSSSDEDYMTLTGTKQLLDVTDKELKELTGVS